MTTDHILIADPRVLALEVDECGEEVVDLRALPYLQIDTRERDPDGLWCLVREGVARRLLDAASAAPDGVGLLVVEAFRSVERQRVVFEEYAASLSADHPDWDLGRVRVAASRYAAPPDIDPPHSTGAAVDVTLVGEDGRELDLGTSINATPEESRGACFTDAHGLSPRAAANRALLCRVMTAAGFVNYPTEWWHWSYGDRYWAYRTGRTTALYGPAPAVGLARAA